MCISRLAYYTESHGERIGEDQRQTHPAVEPNGNLLLLLVLLIVGREEPKEEVITILLVGNWQKTSVRLADIEVYLGNTSTIDGELCAKEIRINKTSLGYYRSPPTR